MSEIGNDVTEYETPREPKFYKINIGLPKTDCKITLGNNIGSRLPLNLPKLDSIICGCKK